MKQFLFTAVVVTVLILALAWVGGFYAPKMRGQVSKVCQIRQYLSPTMFSPNPFQPGDVWQGKYECAQGWTDLNLHILDEREGITNAVFEFSHPPTNVYGRYSMTGQYNAKSGTMIFVPREWIDRPYNYVMVGMDGRVAKGRSYKGDITYSTCGAFHLQRTARHQRF